MRRPVRWTSITLLLLSLGCGGWSRLPENGLPRQPASFRMFEVWSGERRHLWHAVRLKGDSLTGIPSTRSIECDQCRLAVAAADVDSVRAGGTDRSGSSGFSILAGWIMGGLLLFHLIRLTIYGGT